MPEAIKKPNWTTKQNGDVQDADEFNKVVEAVRVNADVQKKQLRVDVNQNFTDSEKAQARQNIGVDNVSGSNSGITFTIGQTFASLPTNPKQGDIFELTENQDTAPSNVQGGSDAGKFQYDGTNWIAKSDELLYEEVLELLNGKLDKNMANLPADLTDAQKTEVKSKLDIDDAAIIQITKDGKTGYGTKHRQDNPNFYGDIGYNAVDLSHSFEEGDNGALGSISYAEGYKTIASGNQSHAEGHMTEASGNLSHAEGHRTKASGNDSHAEGYITEASGYSSHAEGAFTKASGDYSHAEGVDTEAKSHAETARGSFNYSPTPISPNTWHENDLIESVGGGNLKEYGERKNLFARYKNGAFYWIKKTLSDITNAVKGFHAADTDGRLNYYNGIEWDAYALQSKYLGFDMPISGVINLINAVQGKQWTIEYNDTTAPTFQLDGTAITPNIILNEFAEGANRVYVHCVAPNNFDVTIKSLA